MDKIKNTLHSLTEGYRDIPTGKTQIDREKSKYEQALYSVAQDIIKSEELRTEIIKNIGNEPTKETLMKSLKCISLMIGDETFYKVTTEKIARS